MSLTSPISNLSIPTSQVEVWRKLAQSMVVSRGPGSGSLSPNSGQSGGQGTAPPSGSMWMRKINFSLFGAQDESGNPKGDQSKGRDLSILRTTFNIKHQQAGSPATLWARIYNMSPETMAKVIQFGKVQVQAGYKYAAYGLIFEGKVIQYRRGKENPTDTYLEIHAADGDDRANRGIMLAKFADNTKDKAIADEAIKQLGYENNSFMSKNLIADLDKAVTQRANTKATTIRDQLQELANKHNGTFFFQHGKLIFMKRDESLEGKAVVLSPKTGLIGQPEVTPQGITAQCLLNPNIKVGSKVKIETAVLSGVAYTPGTAVTVDKNNQIQGNTKGGVVKTSAQWGAQLETAFTSPTGTYKVVLLEHQGDTRGDAWFCNLTCVALDENGKAMRDGNPANALSRGSAEALLG